MGSGVVVLRGSVPSSCVAVEELVEEARNQRLKGDGCVEVWVCLGENDTAAFESSWLL